MSKRIMYMPYFKNILLLENGNHHLSPLEKWHRQTCSPQGWHKPSIRKENSICEAQQGASHLGAPTTWTSAAALLSLFRVLALALGHQGILENTYFSPFHEYIHNFPCMKAHAKSLHRGIVVSGHSMWHVHATEVFPKQHEAAKPTSAVSKLSGSVYSRSHLSLLALSRRKGLAEPTDL